jgi:hypothetical protein
MENDQDIISKSFEKVLKYSLVLFDEIDQILKIKKHENYQDNYVFANKNRYQENPELKFNIYNSQLIQEKKLSQE